MTMPQPDDGLEGLAPVETRPPAGIMPNAQHQTFHGFMAGAPYELAIVEFDDQGRCYDRGQMDGVAKRDEATIGDLEKRCVAHALGFVPEFRTHSLMGPVGDKPFELDPPGSEQANPFWVVGAAEAVIDGHGGIWQTPFLLFIATLLFQHVQASQKGPAKGGAAPGDLAAFARSIAPIKVPAPR
jgi:hypothetical protein